MSFKVVILVLCLGYISAKGTQSFLQNKVSDDTDRIIKDRVALVNLDTEVTTDWPDNSCDVLDEINHLRTDPVGFSDQYLVPMLPKFSPYDYGGQDYWIYQSDWGRILKQEGPSAVQECIDVLNDPTLPAMEPLAYSDALGRAA